MTTILIVLTGFSVSEWGVIDASMGKAISSAGATGEETEMPVVKAPVIYFYGSVPKEITLSLGISPNKMTVSEPGFTEINKKPSWKVSPSDAKKAAPAPSCWTDPAATPILANGAPCDYIFYEASLSYENRIRIQKGGEKIGFQNSGEYPVYDIIYIIGYPGTENGILLAYYIPSLETSETIWPEPATIPSEEEIKGKMISTGLTEGAASAFLKEWWPVFTLRQEKEKSGIWFQEGSLITSVFAYRLSQKEVDEILPMTVNPKPGKIARVWWALMR